MEHDDSGRKRQTWRERERLRAKEEILAAAEELFARFGYEGTSMKQIAERAELSVGKLYHHFKGKEEIFCELLERYIQGIHARIEGAGDPDDPPLRQLLCIVETVTENLREHRNFVLMYLNENPMKLRGMVKDKEKIGDIKEIIARLFAEAIERGDIPKEDPKMLAEIFIGAAHGLFHMLVEGGEENAFEAVPEILDRIILKPLEMRRGGASGMEGS